MTNTTQPAHQIGTTGAVLYAGDSLPTLQASAMASVLGAPPANGNPYQRSVALIVDLTDLYALQRLLANEGNAAAQADDRNSLANVLDALTERPESLR